MFPYADTMDMYWTGYYTSRPDAKRQARQTSSDFHAAAKLYGGKLIQKEGVAAETTRAILENKDAMLDALGIMQHHDAITGTAKQPVANDYSELMTDAVNQNNRLYSELIGERAADAGLDSALNWKACKVSTTSPINCGLESHEISLVTAHNPSTVDQELLRIRAPHDGAFKVYTLDSVNQAWKLVAADLMCHNEQDPAVVRGMTCELFIKARVKGHGLAHLKVESVNPDEADAVTITPKSKQSWISNEHVQVEFVQSIDDELVHFKIKDKLTA